MRKILVLSLLTLFVASIAAQTDSIKPRITANIGAAKSTKGDSLKNIMTSMDRRADAMQTNLTKAMIPYNAVVRDTATLPTMSTDWMKGNYYRHSSSDVVRYYFPTMGYVDFVDNVTAAIGKLDSNNLKVGGIQASALTQQAIDTIKQVTNANQTATNGLTKSGTNTKLGGALTNGTTITGGGVNNLSVSGLTVGTIGATVGNITAQVEVDALSGNGVTATYFDSGDATKGGEFKIKPDSTSLTYRSGAAQKGISASANGVFLRGLNNGYTNTDSTLVISSSGEVKRRNIKDVSVQANTLGQPTFTVPANIAQKQNLSSSADSVVLTDYNTGVIKAQKTSDFLAPSTEIYSGSTLPTVAATKIGNKYLYVTATDTTEMTAISSTLFMADVVRGVSTPSVKVTSGTQTIDYTNAIWFNSGLSVISGQYTRFVYTKSKGWFPEKGYYDITDFGADKTGIVNAQAALDRAQSILSVDATLYLPQGTYLIDSVKTTNTFDIRGEGKRRTKLKSSGSSYMFDFNRAITGGTRNRVQDITLEGENIVRNGTATIFDNVFFVTTNVAVMTDSGGIYRVFRDCEFIGGNYHFYLRGIRTPEYHTGSTIIENCKIGTNANIAGVYIKEEAENGGMLKFSDCYFESANGFALLVDTIVGVTTPVNFNNCWWEDNGNVAGSITANGKNYTVGVNNSNGVINNANKIVFNNTQLMHFDVNNSNITLHDVRVQDVTIDSNSIIYGDGVYSRDARTNRTNSMTNVIATNVIDEYSGAGYNATWNLKPQTKGNDTTGRIAYYAFDTGTPITIYGGTTIVTTPVEDGITSKVSHELNLVNNHYLSAGDYLTIKAGKWLVWTMQMKQISGNIGDVKFVADNAALRDNISPRDYKWHTYGAVAAPVLSDTTIRPYFQSSIGKVRIANFQLYSFDTKKQALDWLNGGTVPSNSLNATLTGGANTDSIVTTNSTGDFYKRTVADVSGWVKNGNNQYNNLSGNIGIGVNPSHLLHLQSGTVSPVVGLYSTISHASNRNWAMGSILVNYGDFFINTSTAQGGNPISAGVNRFYISNTGNIGFNTTSPSYKLDIDAKTGSAGNPIRLQGLLAGTTTDSIVSSASGVLKRLSIADVSGASRNYAAISTNTTLTSSNSVVNITASSVTATLPTAVGATGKIYKIKLTASGTATVATTSSQTIDGATTYSLSAQYKYIEVVSDGANWMITANN